MGIGQINIDLAVEVLVEGPNDAGTKHEKSDHQTRHYKDVANQQLDWQQCFKLSQEAHGVFLLGGRHRSPVK